MESQCEPRAPREDALPSPLRSCELNDAPPAREGGQRADGTLNRSGQAGGEAGVRVGLAPCLQTMFEWSPSAVEAWSALVTAVAAGVGVIFFVYDRYRAKPRQVSGYLALTSRGTLSIYLFSETGERMILTSLEGAPFFELAAIDVRSPAAQKRDGPLLTLWSTSKRLRKVAEAGHTGNTPLAEARIRIRVRTPLLSRLGLLIFAPTITARGVLPYRTRGSRFKVELGIPESNLREAVLRMEQKRSLVS